MLIPFTGVTAGFASPQAFRTATTTALSRHNHIPNVQTGSLRDQPGLLTFLTALEVQDLKLSEPDLVNSTFLASLQTLPHLVSLRP